MNEIILLLALGLVAGLFSGMVGIGGGMIIVPALVFFMGFTQHMAQGTALFMMMFPIGILGVINYYKAGYVDWKTSLIIAITFFVGSFLGSKISIGLSQDIVKRIFGVVILLVAIKMIIGK